MARSVNYREIADICYIRFGRKPSQHDVQRVIADEPPPSLKARRYQPWKLIPDPAANRNTLFDASIAVAHSMAIKRKI